VHVSAAAVKQNLDEVKDRENLPVSNTREPEDCTEMCINRQRRYFEIIVTALE
jgi:hypothetical protein